MAAKKSKEAKDQEEIDLELESLASEDDQGVLDEAATEEIGSEAFSISSYGADYAVDGLVKRLRSGAFYVPTFQRSFVWNQRQASRFIESLLMGLPVPGIFVFKESDSSKHLIVDGQQRLRTLDAFYQGIFRERSFRLLDVNKVWSGKTYKDLNEDDRQRLDDAIIHTTVFKQDKPENDKESIYEVFERINTGGVKLSAQEIRACVSSGDLIDLLRELNTTIKWREIYGPKSERLKDEELILRFIALATDGQNYKRPMRRYLNKYLDDKIKLTEQQSRQFKTMFQTTIQFARDALGENVFRPERQLNAAVFDAVMVGLYTRFQNKKAGPDAAKAKDAYLKLLESDEFKAAYTKSTADGEQVQRRLRLAVEAFRST